MPTLEFKSNGVTYRIEFTKEELEAVGRGDEEMMKMCRERVRQKIREAKSRMN